MNIIYCRKQAQAAAEYTNTHNPHLLRPVDFKEVCTHVEKAYLDTRERSYKGMYFNFQSSTDGNIFCNIYVAPRFYDEDDQPVTFMFNTDGVMKGESVCLH